MMNLISPRVLRFAPRSALIGAVLMSLLLSATASADTYEDTIDAFRSARDTAPFFDNAYGYAVFPTIGKELMLSVQTIFVTVLILSTTH